VDIANRSAGADAQQSSRFMDFPLLVYLDLYAAWAAAPMKANPSKWPGHFQGIPLASCLKSMTPVSEICALHAM
jgi:hypothetical protein